MYYPPHYSVMYGQAPTAGAVAGGATAAATAGQSDPHMKPDGFLGLDWKSITVAVVVGSLTAVLTQLAIEHVQATRKKAAPKSKALVFTRPWMNE